MTTASPTIPQRDVNFFTLPPVDWTVEYLRAAGTYCHRKCATVHPDGCNCSNGNQHTPFVETMSAFPIPGHIPRNVLESARQQKEETD